MVYNPKLVEELLGKEVAKLFDGTIKTEPSKYRTIFGGSLRVGNTITFTFKENNMINSTRKFIVE